jgi:hypothetical protein
MGTPENTIESPNFSEQALEERTRAFLAEGGPWERLVAAKDTLVELVNGEFLSQGSYQSVSESPLMKFVPNQDCRLVSLYEGLDLDLALDLMVGSYGFSAEFQNGPEGAVNFFLKSTRNRMSRAESVAMVMESFEASAGELSKGKRTNHITSKMSRPTNEEGLISETKREALVRCADEIEKWTAANAGAVSVPVQEQIASALTQYRAALPEVFEYVDYAKAYMRHIDGKETEIQL